MAGNQLPSDASIAGKYLWVNHGKEHRITKPQRRAVLSHVRRGRQVDVQALVSAPVQREITPPEKVDNELTAYIRQLSSQLEAIETAIPPSHRLPANRRSEAVFWQAKAHSLAQRSASPLRVLWKGNSDPFNVFAIPIDCETNQMLVFFRDVVLPTVESVNPGWVELESISHEWNNAQLFLCDEMAASALLARLAATMPSDGALNMRALSYKLRCMTMLRARTANNEITDFNTYHTINILLGVEGYTRDCAAAHVHAMVLARLLQRNLIQENIQFVIRAFYYDYHRAAMSNTPLVFDIKRWIPGYFYPCWRRVLDHLPTDGPQASKKGFDDAETQTILDEFRRAEEVLLSPVEGRNYTCNDKSRFCKSVFAWILARLHHLHLDAVAALSTGYPLRRDINTLRLMLQDFFSLAAHCYIRFLANVDGTSFGEVKIFSANASILALLQKSLATYEWHASSEDILRSADIQLWALYVGSYMEQLNAQQSGGAGAECGWYNTKFALHVRRMGLAVWQDVQGILQTIHYFDGLEPHGSHWFRKTMQANPAPSDFG